MAFREQDLSPSLRQRGSYAYRGLRMRLRRLVQFAHWSALGDRVQTPVFIIGSTRSGKTLLRTCLAAHPDVAAFPGEANHLWHPETHPWIFSPYQGHVGPFWANPEAHTRISLEVRSDRQGEHVRTVFGIFMWWNGGKIFLNDSAKTTFLVPFIRSLFPDARFIHVVRDGRCVAYLQATKIARSIASHRWVYATHGWDLDEDELLVAMTQSWRAHVRGARRQAGGSDSGGGPVGLLEVRYEDLCRSPLDEIRRILQFLDLSPDRFPSALPIEFEDRNDKVRMDLGLDGHQRLTRLLGPTLADLGYS
jgi:hypothetical protein